MSRAAELHRSGQLVEAERIYEGVLRRDPENVTALHLLGVLASQRGLHERAVSLIDRSIARRPRDASFHFNLGRAEEARGHSSRAESAYRRATELDARFAAAHNNLGNVLAEQERTGEALECYRAALGADPGYREAWRNLCARALDAGLLDEARVAAQDAATGDPSWAFPWWCLGGVARRRGMADEAKRCFRRCLDLDPADSFNAAMELAMLGDMPLPEKSPTAFLRRHYGELAPGWDSTVASKGYRGHDLIITAVTDISGGGPPLDVLDLGCGSGALGARLRPLARQLDGVDVSPEMVALARGKGVYDRLEVGDAVAHMAHHPEGYDVIVAAAVLIHFRDLLPVLKAARAALKPGGALVCTVFTEDPSDRAGAGFRCFTHGERDLRSQAGEAGLAPVRIGAAVHEHLAGRPVRCLVAVLDRAG